MLSKQDFLSNPDSLIVKIHEGYEIIAGHKDKDLIEYQQQHSSLISFIENNSDAIHENGQILSLLAYGWMPRVHRKYNPSNFGPHEQNVLTKIAQVCSVEEGLSFLYGCDKVGPISNSWVGTSKFLHFLNPAIFPIWDSHLSRAIDGSKYSSTINSRKNYIQYYELIHAIIAVQNKTVENIARNSIFSNKSKVRIIEFCLFAYGRSKRKHALKAPLK